LFKGKKSETYAVIPKGIDNYNEYFSNESKIELDTFYSLIKDTKNQKWFKDEPDEFPYIIALGKKGMQPGDNVIRGIIIEYYYDENNSEVAHRKYFEKKIFVKKDSIE